MVKLKHCFILLAFGLASANAAAIVKGDEHGEALQRRAHYDPGVCLDCDPSGHSTPNNPPGCLDCDPSGHSAPDVRRGSTIGKGNSNAAGPQPGKPGNTNGRAGKVRRDTDKIRVVLPHPDSRGAQRPGPGHGPASPVHRRDTDDEGQGQQGHDGSDPDPNHPGQKSEHTLAKRFHVDTVEELKSIIHDQNREEMIQFYDTHGHVHCDGPNSETCNHTVCELGALGCRPFTKEEKVKYARQSDELTFKVLSTGRCDPNIEATKDICNEYGYCDVFKLNRHPQTDCPSLTTQKEFSELLSHLEWQDGSGSFVYRKDLQPGSTHGDSSHRSHSGEAGGHMTGHLSKRAISMVESLLARDIVKPRLEGDEAPRDVVEPQPDGKMSPSAGADGKQSSLIKIVKRFGKHLMENRKAPSTSMNPTTDMSEVSKQLEEYLQDAAKTIGWCSEESPTCRLYYCDLGTPDCQHIATDQAKQQFFEDAFRMLGAVYSFGKCTPAADNTDKCSKQGYCVNSNYPEPTPGCERVSTFELPKLYEEIKNNSSRSLYPPGFSPEGDVLGPDGKKTPETIKKEQDQLAEARKELAKNPSEQEFADILSSLPFESEIQILAEYSVKDLESRGFGLCEEASATCEVPDCKLGTPGCSPMDEKATQRKVELYKLVFKKVANTGTCIPSSENEAWCSKGGWCSHSTETSVSRIGCRYLGRENQQTVAKHLKWNPDTQQFYIPGEAQSSAIPPSGVEADRKEKRALRGTNGQDGRGHSEPDQEPSGTLEQAMVSALSSFLAAKELVYQMSMFSANLYFQKKGVCQSGSQNCEDGLCSLGSPGCTPMSRNLKYKMKQMFTQMLERLFDTGTCTPSPANATCNKAGYCPLTDNDGNDVQGCEEQSMDEMTATLKKVRISFDGSNWSYQLPGETQHRFVRFEPITYPLNVYLNEAFGGPMPSKMTVAGQRSKRSIPAAQDAENGDSNYGTIQTQYTDELARVALNLADQQLDRWTKTFGACEPNSAVCGGGFCKLGSPGCKPHNEADIQVLRGTYASIFGRVLITGKCTPKPGNEAQCNSLGYCTMLFSQNNGKTDSDCQALANSEQQHVLDLLQVQDGGEGIDIPEFTDQTLVSTQTPASIPPNPKLPGVGYKMKRDLTGMPTEKKGFEGYSAEKLQKLAEESGAAQSVDATKIFAKDHGVCERKTSACNESYCTLDTAGCRHLSHKDKDEVKRYYAALYTRLLLAGKCHPSTPEGDDQCSKYGHCFVVLNGQFNPHCEKMSTDEHNAFFDKAQKMKNYKDLFPEAAGSGSSKADPKTEQHLSESDHADKYQRHVQAEADKIAYKTMIQESKTTGICEGESETCKGGFCQLESSGCQKMDAKTFKAMQSYWSSILAEVLKTGKCKPSHKDQGFFCSQKGFCKLVNERTGEHNHGCKSLNHEQRRYLIDNLEIHEDGTMSLPDDNVDPASKKPEPLYDEDRMAHDWINKPTPPWEGDDLPPIPSSTERRAGSKWKRDVTSRVGKRVTEDEGVTLGPEDVDVPEYKPTKREIHEFMELCKRLSRDADALEMVAESAGITDPDVIDGLRRQFAYLAEHRDWAIEAIKRAKEAQMIAESKLQAERFGQKGGSDDKPESDDDDKHAHGGKVNDHASAGSKWKRDMAGGPDESVPGYETVTFRPEDSQFLDYKPTKHEIRQFMRLCKQLSHDRAALEEVAHAAEIEDESMIEELREHFAYLAEHRDAAIETIKHAKEAQMIAESKLHSQRFGQKYGSDGDDDGKREAEDKAEDGDDYHGRWSGSGDLASHPSGKEDRDA